MKVICLRALEQPEPGIFGRSITLAIVARAAACDEIIPTRVAAAGSGNDVIKGQFLGREDPGAILASVMIAKQDVLAG
jgi:hypothetical protein